VEFDFPARPSGGGESAEGEEQAAEPAAAES